ncbi:hypothetical protein ACQY0O_002601 [Thecaphora frezii]
MFENDLFASNLAGLELLVKYGTEDGNVPAWNSRDMVSVVGAWNAASGLSNLVQVSEVPGRGHWWDTLFQEVDIDTALEAKCTARNNPGFTMPPAPARFTLTVANPAESGSKGGWSIVEVDTPGKLGRLAVHTFEYGFTVQPTNARTLQFDSAALERSQLLSKWNSEGRKQLSFRFGRQPAINVTFQQNKEFRNSVLFQKDHDGVWMSVQESQSAARSLGPLIRILASKAPIAIVLPTHVQKDEHNTFLSVARRFAADSLLYGIQDCDILLDHEVLDRIDSDNSTSSKLRGNMVLLGGPLQNLVSRRIMVEWPGESSVTFFPSGGFKIRDRPFGEPDTGLLMLAPHPSQPHDAMTMILHGTDEAGIERAARALPVRTGTMIPEWIVLDAGAEWAGEGGIQAAGWWDSQWQWSESMSYLG